MGMKVIRDDVQANTTSEVAGYGDITIHAGNAIIESLAQKEATDFGLTMTVHDVRMPDDTERHCAVLTTAEGLPIANYYGEWADDDEQEEDESEGDDEEGLENDGLCEICYTPFCAADLEDGVTVSADCCLRTGMCIECRKVGNHDCDEDIAGNDDDEEEDEVLGEQWVDAGHREVLDGNAVYDPERAAKGLPAYRVLDENEE